MLFLELALQNVAGFSPAARTPLKTGYWVLRAPGPAALAQVVLELCYPDGRGTDAALIAPGQKVGRAGLLLQGNDGITYRLTRELGGAGALHRLNSQAQTYEAITTDVTEMTQFLRGQVGMPTRSVLSDLFTFSGPQLPSQRPLPGQKPKAPVRASNPAAEAAAHQAKLRELENEVQLCRTVDALQFRADGVAGQIFEVEATLKGTEPIEAALRDAQAAFSAAPTPELLRLPPDIVSRCERMPEVEARLQEGLAKLEQDKAAQEAAVPPSIPPLTTDPRFLGGVGAGLLFLVVGYFASGNLRYLAALDVPAFLYAAMVALRYVDDVQKSQQRHRKEDRIAERETKLRNQYSHDAEPVRIAIQALGVESAKDVVEIFARRGALAEQVNQLEAQLADMRAEPSFAAAAARLAQLKAEQESINAELTQKGSYVRDLREVERDIARTQEALEALRAPAAPPPAAAPAPPREDPMPQVFKLATDLFSTDVSTLANHFRDRCTQYLTALTERRWTGLEFDREGRSAALGPSGKTPVGQLSNRDLDFAYLAVRFTLLEKYCARYKVPVLLDDPFAGMDEGKLPLLGRMLKHLGTLTQVLHVAGQPGFVSASDGSLNV